MRIVYIYLLFGLILKLDTVSIPLIRDVFLKPIGFTKPNVTVLLNSTCEQCLCELLNNNNNNTSRALNCYTNGTCEFFPTFPSSYRLKQSIGARFYFLQNMSLNAHACCAPNITELLNRLQTVRPNVLNLTFQPSAFGYDENVPNEAAIIGISQTIICWFNPSNLTFLRNASVWTAGTLALYRGSVFTSKDYTPTIYVLDNEANNQITNITDGSLSRTRKYIFLTNGQTSNALAVFNVNDATNYTLQQLIPFPFSTVHGLAKLNDTLLYASTWTNRRIGACGYQNNTWNCRSFVNATGSGSGSHLTVDECGRIWYVISSFGLRIYDPSGVEIANWNMSLGASNQIFDILLLLNYLLLLSLQQAQKIIQYDPQLSCS